MLTKGCEIPAGNAYPSSHLDRPLSGLKFSRTRRVFSRLFTMNIRRYFLDFLECWNVKYNRTYALSLWRTQYFTTVDIYGPLQTRGETRCPDESASPTWHARNTTKMFIWRLDTGCGPTLYSEASQAQNTRKKA